ncbi:metallophosphoesterase [Mucilaginibacter hurinus]|uniref:Metallophosphoesterase n=1 Tax=Mucilaginibacter hurinus TaxID=2201324 RepID=A0A367GNT9_9SPHI|nr:metallophosphoesterase [Mucilaginibacter hurinus]RCH55147.1 metallophosphoesterase [Mucilaginibacter hurinus]
MLTRRRFITNSVTAVSAITILPAIKVFGNDYHAGRLPDAGKRVLRFAIASDAHYGEPGTNYKSDLKNMITWLNNDHKRNHLDFVIINGDLVHDQPHLLAEVKDQYLDTLKAPFYAVPGNHDHVDTAMWENIFGYKDNFTIEQNGIGLVLGNTTNIKGNIIEPDNAFLKKSLDAYAAKKAVFIVLHIPPVRWMKNEWYFFDFPKTIELINSYPNVKAVLCGHDHSLDGKRMIGNVPCFFDSHIGGSWGTDYKGYRVVEVFESNEVYTYQVNASQNPRINSSKL